MRGIRLVELWRLLGPTESRSLRWRKFFDVQALRRGCSCPLIGKPAKKVVVVVARHPIVGPTRIFGPKFSETATSAATSTPPPLRDSIHILPSSASAFFDSSSRRVMEHRGAVRFFLFLSLASPPSFRVCLGALAGPSRASRVREDLPATKAQEPNEEGELEPRKENIPSKFVLPSESNHIIRHLAGQRALAARGFRLGLCSRFESGKKSARHGHDITEDPGTIILSIGNLFKWSVSSGCMSPI